MLSETGFKVSVVVAIYNIERFLRQCVQSIIEQDYENIEIIPPVQFSQLNRLARWDMIRKRIDKSEDV